MMNSHETAKVVAGVSGTRREEFGTSSPCGHRGAGRYEAHPVFEMFRELPLGPFQWSHPNEGEQRRLCRLDFLYFIISPPIRLSHASAEIDVFAAGIIFSKLKYLLRRGNFDFWGGPRTREKNRLLCSIRSPKRENTILFDCGNCVARRRRRASTQNMFLMSLDVTSF